jgi:Transposase DDE domain
METSRSPLELIRRAYELGHRVWPDYGHRFSRRDFTQPQLFACLALRESLRLSYRKTEAFLLDVPGWLIEIGLEKVPDHNTLWRAFGSLLKAKHVQSALDLMADDAHKSLRADLSNKPLSMDATCYEPRHRSRHYDRVCRRLNLKMGQKYAEKPGKYGPEVNTSRSRVLRRMPKLALAVAAASHRILAVKTSIGNGSDAADFEPLLNESKKRAAVKIVVADAGYDSESNHRLARIDLKVRSIIPAKIGRPTTKAPTGRFRRLMKQRFSRKADKKVYGQRAQSETVNSMMKRNLGEYLRSIKTRRRKQEMCLRALVHNLMLGRKIQEG